MPEKKITHETVRWNTDSLDDYEQSIISVINKTERCELPFNLPPEVKWPSKPRQKNDRAMLLLRAGYAALQEKYTSKEESIEKSEEKSNPAAQEGWQ